MRSSRCHWHAVTDSRASHMVLGRTRRQRYVRRKACVFTFAGWPEHPASPVFANTTPGTVFEFALLWGHPLLTHAAPPPEMSRENEGVQHSIPWIRLMPILSQFWEINEFFCPRRCLSLPEASLSGKTLPTLLHSFHVKTPLWRNLQLLGQLTPHKGGLWVQLANKIKQDEAETLQLKKRQELATLARGVKQSGRPLNAGEGVADMFT